MNNGYGGPAPRLNGSVLVSLRRMNRVLEIDEDSAYAVVEPGVRWFDLYEALRASGSRLIVSVPDLGGAASSETPSRTATYLPTGSDMAAACGMEVVLPSGELLRTGMGAMPGNRAGMCTAKPGPSSTRSSCSRTSESSRRWACG